MVTIVRLNFDPSSQRTINALRNPKVWLDASMEQMTKRYADEITKEAKILSPVSTGEGRRSIRVRPATGAGHEVVANDYMIVMEHGRRPGARMPPSSALEQWAIRKFGISQGRGLGFVIARSIARKGIRPRRFARRAAEKVLADRSFRAKVTRGVLDVFRRAASN